MTERDFPSRQNDLGRFIDEGGSGIFRTGSTEGLYAVDMAGPDGGVMIPYWDPHGGY